MFEGSMVALVTPMLTTGAIDFDALAALVDWHIEQKTDGIVILGTTGEAAAILPNERTQIISHVISRVAGRLPVIVGTGAQSTHASIELTQQAIDLGANGVLLVTPYYVKPTQQGLYEHYCAIAKQCAIPQILYNVPSRTGCDLLPETVLRLSEQQHIVALKDATADLTRLVPLCDKQCQLSMLSGDDATAMKFMLSGGKGVISVASNVMPAMMKLLCDAAISGNRELAVNYNQQLLPLYEALLVESNPIPVKWALQQMGRIGEGLRLPLTTLAKGCQQGLVQSLQQLDVL